MEREESGKEGKEALEEKMTYAEEGNTVLLRSVVADERGRKGAAESLKEKRGSDPNETLGREEKERT